MQPRDVLVTTERELLEREELDFGSPAKRRLYQIARDGQPPSDAPLRVTRWSTASLPAAGVQVPRVRIDTGVYAYETSPDGAVDWWVNFADPSLFFGWSSSLFAQDELQIAEHPALAALRARLDRTLELAPATQAADGSATPVLVRGVPRRLAVDLAPHPELGLPRGIYGNALAAASVEAIEAVAHRVDPPRPSNLIAMAAPSAGYGTYDRDTIEAILRTAFTAFAAAVRESSEETGGVVVHTGFWGCGAFGGNKELMVALQVLAAGLAGIDRVVLYTATPAGREDADAGLATATDLMVEPSIERCIDALVARGYTWGTGNRT